FDDKQGGQSHGSPPHLLGGFRNRRRSRKEPISQVISGLGLEKLRATIYLFTKYRLPLIQSGGHVDILRAAAGKHEHRLSGSWLLISSQDSRAVAFQRGHKVIPAPADD